MAELGGSHEQRRWIDGGHRDVVLDSGDMRKRERGGHRMGSCVTGGGEELGLGGGSGWAQARPQPGLVRPRRLSQGVAMWRRSRQGYGVSGGCLATRYAANEEATVGGREEEKDLVNSGLWLG